MSTANTLHGKVDKIVGRLSYIVLEIANCSLHCPLCCTDAGSFLERVWTKMGNLMYAWPNEVESVVEALVVDLFELMFP